MEEDHQEIAEYQVLLQFFGIFPLLHHHCQVTNEQPTHIVKPTKNIPTKYFKNKCILV